MSSNLLTKASGIVNITAQTENGNNNKDYEIYVCEQVFKAFMKQDITYEQYVDIMEEADNEIKECLFNNFQ